MFKYAALAVLTIATAIIACVEIATAQEAVDTGRTQGPEYPAYDLWTGCCQNTRNYDTAPENRNEFQRDTQSDASRLRRRTVDTLLHQLPDMCILTPVPIDHRVVGCVYHFQPNPAYVTWQDPATTEQ